MAKQDFPFRYTYARPAATVDCVIFGFDADGLKLLLVERGEPPFEGSWALPGGFIRIGSSRAQDQDPTDDKDRTDDEGEDIDEAARRELEEETGLENVFMEQLGAFGKPGRDPRGRVITVAYWAIVKSGEHLPRGGSDARSAHWHPMGRLPRKLAFDHGMIIKKAHSRLVEKLIRGTIAFEFLPEKFSLVKLQEIYETILEKPLDKRNFRKKVMSSGVLKELDEFEEGGKHRPARLYRFDRKEYSKRKAAKPDFGINPLQHER